MTIILTAILQPDALSSHLFQLHQNTKVLIYGNSHQNMEI